LSRMENLAFTFGSNLGCFRCLCFYCVN
jgi:hypothetical protein